MITRVKLVGVCVKDQSRALEFYTKKLGFTVHADVPMGPGTRWIEVAPPAGETRVALFTPPGLEDRIGTFANIVMTCEDVTATYKQLRDRGVTFTQEPERQSWGDSAQFVDSEGNTFVLTSTS